MKLGLRRQTLRLREPLHTSYGDVTERELAIVSLEGSDGVSGFGEAAPLPAYGGPDMEQVWEALEKYRPVVEGAAEDPGGGVRLIEACREQVDLPEAIAALDMALWDRAGRRSGKSVAALLSEEHATSVPVNATLSAVDRSGAAAQAEQAGREGFGCLKVKVGTGDDAGRVAAVRAAAGPEMRLRLDANGAWDVEQAVRSIEALEPAGLELVEEPAHGLEAVRAIRERVAVRVSIDETAGVAGALGAGIADAVCLKVSRCGGIGPLLVAASLVRATGAEIYLASTLDGPLGVAAALHAAAALASRGPLPHCGLATLGMFEGLDDPLAPREGAIEVPSAPGLGVDPL
ncbi:MAG TPA: mandelate racemase/muconate lactonizing enzyme family protein [Solirubrobacteraceae bacterium]|nr:mandelate racemase/muconate lactonizing enzyme family protein [Solirubrobacteraceae bacterium]